MEFLVAMTVEVPAGTTDTAVADTKIREARRAQELAGQGHLLRLWIPPGGPDDWRILGLWSAADSEEMQVIVKSLPLYRWMKLKITPLSPHPNDPALATSKTH